MSAPMTLSAARYCLQPFPPYRFVPGHNPHPTAHPDGHSYRPPGSPEPALQWVPPERWRESPEYLFGADLYNHGYWWEAHETWEGLWQLTDKSGPQGQFLQGLIQCGACHLKRHVGHAEGVARLRRTSRTYLDFVINHSPAPVYMGLDLPQFVASFDRYYDEALRDRPAEAGHEPRSYPYIILDADESADNRDHGSGNGSSP